MKKVIEVLNNEGKKIKINEYRFNPEFHKHVVEESGDPRMFEFNGKTYKTESAMKTAITIYNKKN